jgi:FMN phosphatase YigB (HAD superfamily)
VKPICLFDLDGTLADFDAAMKRDMSALAAPGEPESPPEREDEPTHLALRRRMVKRQPGFWRNLAPINLGISLFREAVRMGYRTAVITKAPRTNFPAWSEKVEWSHAHLLKIDPELQVNLVEDKGLVYGKALVDDWPPYVEAWLAHRPRGLVILPDRPWNQGLVHPRVFRMYSTVAGFWEAVERLQVKYNEILAARNP